MALAFGFEGSHQISFLTKALVPGIVLHMRGKFMCGPRSAVKILHEFAYFRDHKAHGSNKERR